MDLGITTYGFLLLNCSLLVISLIRMFVVICLMIISIFVFSSMREVTFTRVIGDAVLFGISEEALFILGILAGFKNNIRLLFTYQFFVAMLAISKILSLQETLRNEFILKEDIKLSLEDLMNDYKFNDLNANRVEDIQYYFHCCGFEGPQFWIKNPNSTTEKFLPKSCCQRGISVCELKNARKTGCFSITVSTLPNLLFDVHYYTLYPIFEIILFLFGILLVRFIRKTAANSLA